MKGYLVVLASSNDFLGRASNLKYRGVYRIPPYPSKIAEEERAMDEYVFGDFKSEEGVIASLERAKDLLELFAMSPRRYEVIYYETIDEAESAETTHALRLLGYDVAFATGDRWSIVMDYPEHVQMEKYKNLLNNVGLFDQPVAAERFLQEYRRLKLPEYEMNLAVLRVFELENTGL